jgi:3',5'-cyclic AMP phosphodiesterase CpdA
MTTFRLVQISDLHFGFPYGRLSAVDIASSSAIKKATSAMRAVLRKRFDFEPKKPVSPSTFNPDVALALLFELSDVLESKQLDALVVTGDIATTGIEDDLQLSADYFKGVLPNSWRHRLQAIPNLLQLGGAFFVGLPGNHDRYEGSRLLPGLRSSFF